MNVQIVDISLVGDNPTKWSEWFRFQIDFESGQDLQDGLILLNFVINRHRLRMENHLCWLS
jgi:hypothetical protein